MELQMKAKEALYLCMKNIACLNFLEVSSPNFRASLALALLACLTQGCVSLEKIAINKMGDALASGGTTFTSDDDPELVSAAMPFSLKLMETLLEQVPHHKGLLYATASGFTQYGYAFVQEEADRLEDTDLDAAFALRSRAQKLYLRARNYGLRGLDVSMSGFQAGLRENPQKNGPKGGLEGCSPALLDGLGLDLRHSHFQGGRLDRRSPDSRCPHRPRPGIGRILRLRGHPLFSHHLRDESQQRCGITRNSVSAPL